MSVPKIMIYRDCKTELQYQVFCAACPPYLYADEAAEEDMNQTITMYPTAVHAAEAGWRTTRDRMFCKPEEDFVWICPDCVKELGFK